MAIDPTAYALSEFKAAIIAETTAGTILKTSMQLVNIDAPVAITRSPELFVGMRSGAGRIAKAAEVFASEKLMEKSIPISGLYDTTVGKILIENVAGVEVSISPASIDVEYNYTNEITLGEAALSDNIHTLSFVNIIPEGDKSEYYPGCVIDELKLTMDTASDGGRMHFDAVLKTRGNVEIAAAPTTPSVFGTTRRSIYELTAAANAIMTLTDIGGAAEVILESVELNWKANVQWGGLGVDGVGEVINRGMPEFEITGIFGVKFDANTVDVNASYIAGTVLEVEMHNETWATATFGWKGMYSRITADVNMEDVRSGAYVKIPVKFLGHTTGDVFAMIP